MLDKINNNSTDIINQSQNLDRIKSIGVTNPFAEDTDAYFIDESDISNAAMQKYQHDLDIKNFSNILMEINEKEANDLVLQQAFSGNLSIDNDEFINELLINDDFLNDII